MTLNFYLPNFYPNLGLICFMSDIMKQTPECFYEDVKITSAYGCFPNSIWNGGRVFLDRITKQQMVRTIDELNSRGIAVRYTFTNPLIEEKHLGDTFCNMCLELADNRGNEVLVNSPVLEKYLREHYPKFTLISSTTKCLDKLEEVEAELEKDYPIVVLDSVMNNTPELFELKHREKIELLTDHCCEDACPRRRAHYNSLGKAQLEYADCEFPPCQNSGRDFYQLMYNRSFLTNEVIHGKYKEAGFQHFKLDGRAWKYRNVLESFLYYLVKPEWRDKIRLAVLREVYKF